MAQTYVTYDSAKPIGGVLATGVDNFLKGWDEIVRAHAAMNAATDAGTDTLPLISGDFGAATTADAAQMWTQVNSTKTIIDADVAGGLFISLASVDKGASQ